jgi:hypothetical protein
MMPERERSKLPKLPRMRLLLRSKLQKLPELPHAKLLKLPMPKLRKNSKLPKI